MNWSWALSRKDTGARLGCCPQGRVGEGATELGAMDMVFSGGMPGLLAENTGLGAMEPISDIVRQPTADGVASVFNVSFHKRDICQNWTYKPRD
jgi:hypothetical protein